MSKVYIIAEIGVNHNGSVSEAKRLVDAAKLAGVDAVKFQVFSADSLVTKNAPKADYQTKQDTVSSNQYEMLKRLELTNAEFEELKKYCDLLDIDFIATPFDEQSLQFLIDLGVNGIKIGSGEITNYPLLRLIGEARKRIILSTGMCTITDIESAITVLNKVYKNEIEILHCTTEYPAPFEEVNLRVIQTLKLAFPYPVGYSDHTDGIAISLAAVTMGASIIEKHFTMDRSAQGPDHKSSLEPHELKLLVEGIRAIEIALGSSIKSPTVSEMKNRLVARKSIVAKKAILKGELLTEDNLTTKRPGDGISPMMWEDVIGTKAQYNFEVDERIRL